MSIFETPAKDPSSEPKESFVDRFERERKEWTDKVKGISVRFRSVDDLVDVQVDLYSQRQVAVDYQHQLQVLHSKLKKKLATEFKVAYDKLKKSEDFRYSEREMAKFAEEMSGETRNKVEILQTHIDFFRETIRTIDNMIFGVKHRLEIEDFRRGNK